MNKKLRYTDDHIYVTLNDTTTEIYYPDIGECWESIFKLFQASPIYEHNHILTILEVVQYTHNMAEVIKMFSVQEFWEYADAIDPSDLASLSLTYKDAHKYFQNPDFEEIFWEADSNIFDTFEAFDNYCYDTLKDALGEYWTDYNILLKYMDQLEAIELMQDANNYQIITGSAGVYLIPV